MTYSMYGHDGQAGRSRTRDIPSVDYVKALNPPLDYYLRHLTGKLGKGGSKGWFAWNGLCPFHADKHPGSVTINLHSGAFKCHACGASAGDVIAFHRKLYGLSFRDTLAQLGGVE